jgi:hypothetical protein
MADGALQPIRRRGKRPSAIGAQCEWAMRQEIQKSHITRQGFLLLSTPKIVERIHARLTGEGLRPDDLPEKREIRRWQLRCLRTLGDTT